MYLHTLCDNICSKGKNKMYGNEHGIGWMSPGAGSQSTKLKYSPFIVCAWWKNTKHLQYIINDDGLNYHVGAVDERHERCPQSFGDT